MVAMTNNIVYYTIKEIQGDYAVLVTEDGIKNVVARALLPFDADEGTKLKYEFPNYEII